MNEIVNAEVQNLTNNSWVSLNTSWVSLNRVSETGGQNQEYSQTH